MLVANDNQPIQQTLVEALRSKRLLLLLDNCEHLLDACTGLASALLRGCPHLAVLTTSREALGIAGEVSRRVPSLIVPKVDQHLALEGLTQCEAVQLFCERATAARPEFVLTEQNAAPVAQLCRRLDGIPLALELAAARLRALSVAQLAERLDDRFRLLTGGSHTALPRQQTLRAAMDWSYDLLTEPERVLFQRLSAFAGGWTLEAAEAVDAGNGIGREDVLDLLARLVEQSLVQAEEQADGSERYRLLETLRQYGRERLAASGEADAAYNRHADFYLALAEEAFPHFRGPQQADWQHRMEPELDNLRGALRRYLERGNAERGLRLAVAVPPYWYVQGRFGEVLGWLTALLALPGAALRTSLRGQALAVAGNYAGMQGDAARRDALWQEAAETCRAIGDRSGEALAMAGLGMIAMDRGDYGLATSLQEQSLALFRELGDEPNATYRLLWLGRALTYGGNAARASERLREALGAFQRLGDRRGMAVAAEFLGEAAEAAGDDEAARRHVEQALALYSEVGDQPGIGTVNTYLGRLALKRGDRDEARRRFRSGLVVAKEIGHRVRLCDALDGLAALAAVESEPERALRLAGGGAALRQAAGLATPPHERAWLEGRLDVARQAVGEHVAVATWAQGQAMALEQAVAYALGEDGDG